MSEGGTMSRSGRRLRAEKNLRCCLLWFDRPIGLSVWTIGLSARNSSKPILGSSLSPARDHSFGTDRPGLALLIRGKQKMAVRRERGAVTARRIYNVIFMGGSALRTGTGPHQRIHERIAGSLAHVCHGSCRYA